MTKIPNNLFGHSKLEFGAYLGFGICDLEFKTYAPCTLRFLVKDGRERKEVRRQVEDHRQY